MGGRGTGSGFRAGGNNPQTAAAAGNPAAPSLSEYRRTAGSIIDLAQGAGMFSRSVDAQMQQLLGEQPVGAKFAFTKKVPAPIGSANEQTTVTYLLEKTGAAGSDGTGTWVLHEHWSEHPLSPGRTYTNATNPASGHQLLRALHDQLYDEGGERTPKPRPTTGPPFRSR